MIMRAWCWMSPVDVASGEFYSSALFWSIAAVVAGVLGTAVIVMATFWVASTKRRLLYSMPVVTPLINGEGEPGVLEDLEVRRRGQLLASPSVVILELEAKGRRDIPRSAFDDGAPVCLDVGAQIIEVLKVTTTPTDRAVPPYKADGLRLLIGPCLIGRRQIITFSLLVDGQTPKLSLPEQSLTDIEIRRRDKAYEAVARRMRLLVLVGAAISLTLLVTTLDSVLAFGKHTTTTGVLGSLTLATVTAQAATFAALSIGRDTSNQMHAHDRPD
jgi:hypothetical protein